MNLSEMINKKAMELASKHGEIIENEIKMACNKFDVKPNDLIIQYGLNAEIKLLVKASYFKITNQFVCEDGNIIHES